MNIPANSYNKGFTLLELLVAMSIFALLAIMAYAGLATVLDTRRVLEQNMDRLAELQKTVLFISRDLSQMVNRGIRDQYGDYQPALSASALNMGLDAPIIEFTHSGYSNPLGIKRSHLQRVAYHLKEHVLYRDSWQVLDRAQDSRPYKARLCDKVESIGFRYMDKNGQWHTQWPPANNTGSIQPSSGSQKKGIVKANTSRLPKAVEFSLKLNDWGTITQLLQLPGDST
ncbi:MAG: type II secretion system minor pseudopilin GspJ [Gammaproteobacteria bacterium]|nr:type II secretion system minor pseudopilin GspJ [Gammaproteobacteria bacterium]